MVGMAACFVVMLVNSKVSKIAYRFTDAFNNNRGYVHTGSCNSGAVAIHFFNNLVAY